VSDLKIGDRVRTPEGEQIVIALSPSYVTTATRADVDTLYARDALYPHEWERAEVSEPLPPDIPRERVEALLAKVRQRMQEVDVMTDALMLRDELSDVAWELALILEVPHVE